MKGIQIDAAAATPLVRVTGDPKQLEFIKYDITEVAYLLKQNQHPVVFVMGPGGGRDVIAALLYGAKSVDAADINALMIDIVGKYFADYVGRIYDLPNVHVTVDDARSALRRSEKQFDVIQSSMTDTWAATAAGAFSLSENSLYTRQAFDEYWDRLKDDGILSFSRYLCTPPAQTLRVVALALACLEDNGIENPEMHLAVLGSSPAATVIMKKSRFTFADISLLHEAAKKLQYDVLYLPGVGGHETFKGLIETDDRAAFYDDYPLDVSPPVDDRPFFFNLLKFKDVFRSLEGIRAQTANLYAQVSLLFIFIVYLVLFAVATILPLYLKNRSREPTDKVLPQLLFFAAIGLGFMLVEISIMQRMTLFLGHPTYSLVVVLLALLLFSGVGSLLTSTVRRERLTKQLVGSALVVIGLLIVFAVISQSVLDLFVSASLGERVLVCALALLPFGLVMGRMFPLGIKSLSSGTEHVIPWAWAINGLTSVLGSILAIMIGMWSGFTTCLIVAMVSYLVAVIAARAMKPASTV